jgi:RNA-splicing ligase RtcB
MKRTLPTLVPALLLAAGFATAQLTRTAPAVARSMPATDLGPAQSVLIEGSRGTLRLVNEGGRPAWGSDPTARALSMGAVHVDKVLKRLLAAESFREELTRFEEEARAQGETFNKEMEELKGRFGEKKPDDPEFKQGQAAVQALFERYQQWNVGMQAAQNRLMAEQVERAYRELAAAVDTVAERRQVDLVYRSIPADAPFEAQDLGNAMIQVQGRTFLKAPESIDLTDDVLKELNLPRD